MSFQKCCAQCLQQCCQNCMKQCCKSCQQQCCQFCMSCCSKCCQNCLKQCCNDCKCQCCNCNNQNWGKCVSTCILLIFMTLLVFIEVVTIQSIIDYGNDIQRYSSNNKFTCLQVCGQFYQYESNDSCCGGQGCQTKQTCISRKISQLQKSKDDSITTLLITSSLIVLIIVFSICYYCCNRNKKSVDYLIQPNSQNNQNRMINESYYSEEEGLKK